MNFVVFEPKAILIAICSYVLVLSVIGIVKGFIEYRKIKKNQIESEIAEDETNNEN